MWTDAPKWPEFSPWKDKKKSTKALRFIQSHGDRGHVSKQGCALAYLKASELLSTIKINVYGITCWSFGIQCASAYNHSAKYWVVAWHTECRTGKINDIYIFIKKRVGCQEHLRQSGFLFLCCQQFACLHTFNWWRWFSVLRVRDVF